MITATGDGEPGLPPQRELVDLIEHLDSSRLLLHSQFQHYVRMPKGGAQERLRGVVNQHFQAMSAAFMGIRDKEPNNRARAEMVVSLFLDDDAQRVDFLNALLPGDNFSKAPYARDELVTAIETSFEEEAAQAIGGVLTSYKNNLEIDLERLCDLTDQQPRVKAMATAVVVGRHALEVAKITAGVAAGIWLTSRRRNR